MGCCRGQTVAVVGAMSCVHRKRTAALAAAAAAATPGVVVTEPPSVQLLVRSLAALPSSQSLVLLLSLMLSPSSRVVVPLCLSLPVATRVKHAVAVAGVATKAVGTVSGTQTRDRCVSSRWMGRSRGERERARDPRGTRTR